MDKCTVQLMITDESQCKQRLVIYNSTLVLQFHSLLIYCEKMVSKTYRTLLLYVRTMLLSRGCCVPLKNLFENKCNLLPQLKALRFFAEPKVLSAAFSGFYKFENIFQRQRINVRINLTEVSSFQVGGGRAAGYEVRDRLFLLLTLGAQTKLHAIFFMWQFRGQSSVKSPTWARMSHFLKCNKSATQAASVSSTKIFACQQEFKFMYSLQFHVSEQTCQQMVGCQKLALASELSIQTLCYPNPRCASALAPTLNH